MINWSTTQQPRNFINIPMFCHEPFACSADAQDLLRCHLTRQSQKNSRGLLASMADVLSLPYSKMLFSQGILSWHTRFTKIGLSLGKKTWSEDYKKYLINLADTDIFVLCVSGWGTRGQDKQISDSLTVLLCILFFFTVSHLYLQ